MRPTFFLQRLCWLNLPAALLIALLQRTPLLRLASLATEIIRASPIGVLLRSAIPLGSLGAVHAQTGATQFRLATSTGLVAAGTPISGTVGTPLQLSFTYTGTPSPPASFRIVGSLPGGLAFIPTRNASDIVNASTVSISGIPTGTGAFSIYVQGFNNLNATGETNNVQVPIVFDISAGSGVPPAFTLQPTSQTVSIGATVTFSAGASGTPAPAYQWRRDGNLLIGATAGTLTLTNVQPADAGAYSVVATNAAGSATSSPATLVVRIDTPTARLANLSVRTAMSAGQTLIVGVVVDEGARDILVRAAGPALAEFGLSTAMIDPHLELYDGASTMVLSNDNWLPSLAPTIASVGAFPFSPGSKDAAFVRSIHGAYSIQTRGTGAGVVLVEAYDTDGAPAARLVNVSARSHVGIGDDILIAGVALTGAGDRQLLIRAVGPRLAEFGVEGALGDPKLEIYNAAGVKLTENDNWNASLAETFARVGAFALVPGSNDAALLATLSGGTTHTIQVKGADGGTGEALIEVYEVP